MKKAAFKKGLVMLMVCTNFLSPMTSIAATTIESSQTFDSTEQTVESSDVPGNTDSSTEINVPENSDSNEPLKDNLSLAFNGTTFYKNKDFDVLIKGVVVNKTFVLSAPSKVVIQEGRNKRKKSRDVERNQQNRKGWKNRVEVPIAFRRS